MVGISERGMTPEDIFSCLLWRWVLVAGKYLRVKDVRSICLIQM